MLGRGALDGVAARLPRLRRERRGARAALGHDGADRARRRHPLRRAPSCRCASPTSPTATAAIRPQRGQPREFLQAGIELIGAAGAAGHGRGGHRAVPRARRAPASRATASASATPRCTRRCSRASASPQERARRRCSTSSAAATSSASRPPCARSSSTSGQVELLLRGARSCAAAPTSCTGPPGPVADAVAGLRAVHALLEPDVAARVIFDLGLSRAPGYYSGAVFEVYDPAVGMPIGGGGRYDHLLGQFGRALPAVGFALEVEQLHQALAAEERLRDERRPDDRRPARRALRRRRSTGSTASASPTGRGPRQRAQAALRGRRADHDAPLGRADLRRRRRRRHRRDRQGRADGAERGRRARRARATSTSCATSASGAARWSSRPSPAPTPPPRRCAASA